MQTLAACPSNSKLGLVLGALEQVRGTTVSEHETIEQFAVQLQQHTISGGTSGLHYDTSHLEDHVHLSVTLFT
mgnify:CR=1 FL=1